jgi:hypothetical protein
MRVACAVEEERLDGDHGPVDGVVVTCSRCHASSESFGTSPASVRRCFILLHEQCGEINYYYVVVVTDAAA